MTQWIVAILEVALRALLQAIFKASKDTAEDAAKQTQLRDENDLRLGEVRRFPAGL